MTKHIKNNKLYNIINMLFSIISIVIISIINIINNIDSKIDNKINSLMMNNRILLADKDRGFFDSDKCLLLISNSDRYYSINHKFRINIPDKLFKVLYHIEYFSRAVSDISKLYMIVMIPTFVITTVIFTILFIYTNITFVESMIIGLPLQFIIMFVFGYLKTDLNIIHINKFSFNDVKYIMMGLIGLIGLNFSVQKLIQVLNVDLGTNTMVRIVENNPELIWLVIPFMFIFVGPVEEFIFRGVIQGMFRKYYSVSTSIIIASVYFGITHILAVTTLGIGAIYYVIIATLLGIILGYIYEKTENITVPILCHAIYNSILFLLLVI